MDGLAGLTAGAVYFLSASSAGALTVTEPSLSKPVFIASASDAGYFYNFRGLTGSPPIPTDFYATMSGNFTLNDAAFTKMPFDTVTRDTNSEWDAGNTRWVCKTPGTYMITGLLVFTANATGGRGVALSLNGDTTLTGKPIVLVGNTGSSVTARPIMSIPYALTTNDTVEILGFQNRGGTLIVIASGSYFCINRLV
jgi:hypothetical protein